MLTYGVKSKAVSQVWHVGTHFSFLFSIYSENHGVQAEPLNFTRSSDITCETSLAIAIIVGKSQNDRATSESTLSRLYF